MTTSLDPQEDIPRTDTPMYPDEPAEILRKWRVCTPETVPPFSAVAYFFGRAIHRDVTVPVGLIQTAWGGTVCAAWTSADTLRGHPDFGAEVTRLQEDATPFQQLLQEYEAALAAWQKKAVAADAGYANGEPAWAGAGLNDSDWAEIELPNLFNAEGLPASPFRTDNLPGLTVMNR